MPKTTHTEAAEHHEKAAKSHRTAAEHHESGDHAAASKYSDEAHGHSTKAHASSSARARARNRSKRGGGLRCKRLPPHHARASRRPRPACHESPDCHVVQRTRRIHPYRYGLPCAGATILHLTGPTNRPTPNSKPLFATLKVPVGCWREQGSGKTDVLTFFVLRLLYVENDPVQAARVPPEWIFVTAFTERRQPTIWRIVLAVIEISPYQPASDKSAAAARECPGQLRCVAPLISSGICCECQGR
jgi:hypothetical protein